MKRQNRSEALGNFFKPLATVAAVVFIGAFALNHSQNNNVMSSDNHPTDTSVSANESIEEKELTEKADISLSFFRDNENLIVTTKTSNSIFSLVDAYLEDDHIILVFDFENISNEPVEPLSAYRQFIDELTQEDDNAIYNVEINHFYDLTGRKEIEKISSGNPKIKSNGKFTFYAPYTLETNSSVTINLKNGSYPIVISLD